MSIFPYYDETTGLTFVGPPIAHGEVTIVPIAEFVNAGEHIPLEDGKHILGHSESGHHHVLERENDIVRLRDETSPDIDDVSISAPVRSYLEVISEKVRLTHLKSKNATHRHADQIIAPGKYLVTTGVQYTPKGMRRVVD